MPRRLVLVLAALAVVAGACSSGDDSASSTTRPAGQVDEVDATAPELDQSAFCVAVRDLEALGTQGASGDGSPEEVLRQNGEVIRLVEAAASSAPDDAPQDVQRFFEDYLQLSEAVTVAGGDTDAAYAALTAEEPQLLARLTDVGAHRQAFEFFAERCGTAPPP